MNIDSLNQGRNIGSGGININQKATNTYTKNSDNKEVTKTGDKLELSVEAIKLQPIKQKIAEGFYDNPKVLDQVAKKLYDQFIVKGDSKSKK